MSKLSILQEIFPLTFYEGWKKAISPPERYMHSTSTVLNSSCVSLMVCITKWSEFSGLRIQRVWWITGGSLLGAQPSSQLSTVWTDGLLSACDWMPEFHQMHSFKDSNCLKPTHCLYSLRRLWIERQE